MTELTAPAFTLTIRAASSVRPKPSPPPPPFALIRRLQVLTPCPLLPKVGTLCAFGSFRMVFASIWDFRFNHILLPRQQSLCILFHPPCFWLRCADQPCVPLSFIRHPKASAPGRFDYSLGSSAASGLNEKAGAHGHHGHGNGVAGVNAPFTRDGGWGTISFQQGAPGDAAYGSGSHGTLGEQRGAGFV